MHLCIFNNLSAIYQNIKIILPSDGLPIPIPYRRCQNHRVSIDVTAVERSVSGNASANILEIIHAQNPEEGSACQAVLYEAYQGCCNSKDFFGPQNSPESGPKSGPIWHLKRLYAKTFNFGPGQFSGHIISSIE